MPVCPSTNPTQFSNKTGLKTWDNQNTNDYMEEFEKKLQREKNNTTGRRILEEWKVLDRFSIMSNQNNFKTLADTTEPLVGQQKGYECTKIFIEALLTG